MISVVGNALYQWDTGRYVTVTDIEADHIHFSNKGDSKAVVMELTDSKSQIPNYLFQTGRQLCVYVVKNGITIESCVFPVIPRERPEYYIYEEDQRNYVYELIESAEQATEAANKAAEEILAAKERGDFNGPQGPAGKDGKDGKDGEDGNPNAVLFTPQELTDEQKAQARANIGATSGVIVPLKDGNYNIRSINHRGYCTEAPENTIPAFIKSKENGFNFVECDVSFTADNVAVLLHDATIDRTSNGTGNIADLTYEQVLQYDFGSWMSAEYAGTKIPTLREFLMFCKATGLHPYIEIKENGNYTTEQIESIVDLVKETDMYSKVTYISFSSVFLSYVRDVDPTARLGYITYGANDAIVNEIKNLQTGRNDVFIDCVSVNVTDAVVSACVANGIPLEVWTVNEQSYVESMNLYISGVTSDNLHSGKILYDLAMSGNLFGEPSTITYNVTNKLQMGSIESTASANDYLMPNTNRASYRRFDIPVTPGDVISVNVTESGYRFGVRSMNTTCYNSIMAKENFTDANMADSYWKTTSYTIPETVNGEPPVYMWFTISKPDNSSFDLSALGEVIVTRVRAV